MLILELTSKATRPNTNPPVPVYHCVVDDIVKNITVDENLTTNLESSSSLWKITLPHDCPYSLEIIAQDELKAVLKDVDKDHPEIIYQTFFTGWVSNSFNYTIDQYGQNAVQITLEDNGTHLLKAPYTKQESEVVKGKFSSLEPDSDGKLGVVQQICEKCGITFVGGVTDETEVKAVAEAAETCESLLKSVCKEMRRAYSFNEFGQLYLVPLSTDSIPADPPLYDNSLYDSINLVKRARTYRGSRIKWTELNTTQNALIYRDITNQSATHPDCYIEISNGTYYPSPDGVASYIDATDLKNGSEIFSIDNLSTVDNVVFDPANCAAASISKYGANQISVLVTGLASGHITKLQATADMTYIKNHNVIYGNAKEDTESSITDNLHEEECRWIHDNSDNNYNPVTKYANFIAQYDRYSSREFTFKTKYTYSLGQIIHLNENLHTGLDNYLMVTRRTRTLTAYDETNRQFSGMWTYVAVSTREFNYTKTVTEESTSIPPTSSYTQVLPDMEELSGIQLTTDLSFLKKDLRSSATQTMNIYASVIGELTGIVVTASYSDGTPITVTPDPQVDNKWSITVPENKNVQGVNITARVGSEDMNTIYVSYNDKTQYYKFLGNYSSDPTESQADSVILVHDFYVNTTDGKTIECTGRTETSSVPIFTWAEMPLNADNANKFLTALESVTQAGIPLENLSNPNTVSWFNTIIAAKAVIDNLFSRYITILNGGSIHSTAYSDTGTYVGPGAGFYLGSDGTFKCYSADMTDIQAVNANISGNSSFHGSFDCTVIKTTPESPSTYITLDGSVADGAQAKRLTDQMILNGLISDYALQQTISPMLPIQIVGVSGISYMRVAYQGGSVQSGTARYRSTLRFYDSSGTEVNIRNYVTCSKSSNLNWVNFLHSSNYDQGSDTSYHGQWASNGIQIKVLTGQNRLWVDVPDSNNAGALSSGMLFKARTSQSIDGVTGYPLYVKA